MIVITLLPYFIEFLEKHITYIYHNYYHGQYNFSFTTEKNLWMAFSICLQMQCTTIAFSKIIRESRR